MRHTYALLAVAVITGGFGPASAQDSAGASAIELVDQGLLECQFPNARAKTCRSLGAYERIRDGVYNTTTLLALRGGVTLEYYTPAWLTEDAFCGSIREQDVMTGVLRVGGRELAPEIAEPALQRALEQLRPFVDQEICTRYEPSDTGFVAKLTVAGEYRPELDAPVRMVDPGDGYRIAR